MYIVCVYRFQSIRDESVNKMADRTSGMFGIFDASLSARSLPSRLMWKNPVEYYLDSTPSEGRCRGVDFNQD